MQNGMSPGLRPILLSFPLGVLANCKGIQDESERWILCGVRWVFSGPPPVGLTRALHYHLVWALPGTGDPGAGGSSREEKAWILITRSQQRGMQGVDGVFSCSVGLCPPEDYCSINYYVQREKERESKREQESNLDSGAILSLLRHQQHRDGVPAVYWICLVILAALHSKSIQQIEFHSTVTFGGPSHLVGLSAWVQSLLPERGHL